MQAGFWCFKPPAGYRFTKDKELGRMMARDEPVASVIAEAYEGYANGRFEGPVEVRRYFQANPVFPKTRLGTVAQQKVTDVLTNPLYAGYINHERWGLHLVPAKHEPLVSYETFRQVQERRKGVAKAPARKDLNEDFALRGFVTWSSPGFVDG